MCRLSWNLGTSASWNPLGLFRPVMGLLLYYYYYLLSYMFTFPRDVFVNTVICSFCKYLSGIHFDVWTSRKYWTRGVRQQQHCCSTPYHVLFLNKSPLHSLVLARSLNTSLAFNASLAYTIAQGRSHVCISVHFFVHLSACLNSGLAWQNPIKSKVGFHSKSCWAKSIVAHAGTT